LIVEKGLVIHYLERGIKLLEDDIDRAACNALRSGSTSYYIIIVH